MVINALTVLLVFAGLLQTSVSPAPASNQQAAPNGGETQSADDLATIVQSGSTNTRGYKVEIHKDGSATVEFTSGSAGASPKEFPAGTIDTRTLQQLLNQVGDVSKIQTGMCAKSVSFGTRTEISYQGKTSADLQCVRREPSGGDETQQAAEELSKFVMTALGQLKINTHRVFTAP